jgi:RNA polymerase sigma-70 factor (ECF subfamily)
MNAAVLSMPWLVTVPSSQLDRRFLIARSSSLASEASPGAADAALVRAARAGDRDAFGRLVRTHLRAAHAAALAVVGNSSDAEDVCQDAFLTALERLDDCRPEEKFRPWLLTIVRNRAIDLRRRKRVREAEPLEETETQVGGGPRRDPHHHAEQADLQGHLTAAIARLPDVRREVLLLYDLDGWSHAEISAYLGLPVATVRVHLFRARREVREWLSPELRGGSHDV